MRLLFVSPTDLSAPRGGRAMLARLHRDVLSELLGADFAEHHLGGRPAGVGRRLVGYIDSATPDAIADVIEALDRHGAQAVWLDGSNLGRLGQAVRRARPTVRILTFFHNVEARFFWGALRRRWHPRAAAVMVGNYLAERTAVRHSDEIVALSERDGAALRRLYRRGADHLLPMAVADQARSPAPPGESVADDAPLLFVGGSFYANLAGIGWFAREVAPRVALPVQVVGQGMESLRDRLAGVPTIEVIGPVDDLEPWYRAARVAIAPIFDGSGMKTKVAEALMFGKRIIGTAEAFSGYEAIAAEAGWQSETPAAFLAAIDEARRSVIPAFDPALRALYERDHSPEAVRRRLAAILG